MALGRPVVTTQIGYEGINASNEKELMVGNTPQEMADQICRLLSNKKLESSIIQEGRALVEREYDWDVIASQYENSLLSLLPKKKNG